MKNHLAGEKGPYLKQHAENPVDWYPWSEEAFEKAREMDKPIFLSIGYSTCHWCHVMAHESFENMDMANMLNEIFVSIKVDREERPDIDTVYMKAAMLATGKGGWPLSIFMTPEGKPFFAGTYIPRESRYGMMGLKDLVQRIDHLWKNSRDELIQNSEEIVKAMNYSPEKEGMYLDENIIETAYQNFRQNFDQGNGGFGTSPKFPSPHQLIFLLGYHHRTGEEEALEMAERTLSGLLNGGINDHVGGGFHRYSTDREWLVPHFEKMLYDQAMLIMAFTDAYLATGNEKYSVAVERIVEYIERDLLSPDGLYFSAEDADSEGEEGKFYVWTREEIIGVKGIDDASKFCKIYNINGSGNFRDEGTGRKNGKNILHLSRRSGPIHFEDELELLRSERERRPRPSRDEKVLTDWNALMVSALSRAGQALENDNLIAKAMSLMKALEEKMRSNEKWFHRSIEGEKAVEALLDDLAFLSLAYQDLYEAAFDVKYLKSSILTLESIIENFTDRENGGFFQTSKGSKPLISREKEAYDGAMPSGNSVIARALIRAARMTGDSRYEEIAYSTFKTFSSDVNRSPTGFAMMLTAFMHAIGPSREIVIAGKKGDPATEELISAVRRCHIPNGVMILKEPGKNGEEVEIISPFTKDMVQLAGMPTAYVCKGGSCDIPVNDPETFRVQLASNDS